MKGQWIGAYHGSVEGRLMINIDEVDGHYEAVVYANPNEKHIPSTVTYISTKNKRKNQKTTAFVNPVDPRNGFQCKWDDIKHLYPEGVIHSDQAEVSLKEVKGKRSPL